MEDDDDLMVTSIVPKEFKALRACLRCSLIKEFRQFFENGCENCEFLAMQQDHKRVAECTTAYFEGTVALVEPGASWVAKWQRIGHFEPGLYAIEVLGQLPDDAQEYVDNYASEQRPSKTKA